MLINKSFDIILIDVERELLLLLLKLALKDTLLLLRKSIHRFVLLITYTIFPVQHVLLFVKQICLPFLFLILDFV